MYLGSETCELRDGDQPSTRAMHMEIFILLGSVQAEVVCFEISHWLMYALLCPIPLEISEESPL